MIGANLSHYRIDAELGRGGMGIVYRAHDTKLNRDVALKVLPAAALASADDRARFFREAQAAAQLTHPNIATIHQIDEAIPLDETGAEMAASDGPRPFIAMELIEGQTLSEEIAKGPFKLDEAVRIAAQVAGALKAAHAKDIVHRDIKSANVMLTPDGVAKVLDFGLAKTNQSTQLTRMGSTLGTVAYMSPEQARGQEVDGRSDLYSLGTMLYEMIAGRLPFAGEYEQAVVYGILNESPEPLTAVRTGVPMGLEWIVTKLLAKEPRHRYQTAADLMADLETVDLSGSGLSRRSMPAATGAIAASAVRPKTDARLVAGVAALAIVATLTITWLWGDPAAEILRPTREFQLLMEPASGVSFPVISPDGSFMAYFATDSLGQVSTFLSRLDGQPPEKLPIESNAFYLYISADNKYIVASDPLSVYSLETKSTVQLNAQDFRGSGIVLPQTSEVLYARMNGPLMKQPVSGGTPTPVTELAGGEDSHSRVALLPDQKHIVFTRFRFVNMDSTDLFIGNLETGEQTELLEGAHTPMYLPSGHLLYYRGPKFSAFVQPFDPSRMQFSGPARRLGDRFSQSSVSVDQYGTLMLGPRTTSSQASLGAYFVTPDGTPERGPLEIHPSAAFLSRGGAYLATRTEAEGRAEIHVFNVMDTDMSTTPVLRLPSAVTPFFRLTRDGKWLGYFRDEAGKRMFVKREMDTGLETVLDLGINGTFDWIDPDHILIVDFTLNAQNSMFVYDLTTSSAIKTVYSSGPDTIINFPSISPNGKWVAFTETDRLMVKDLDSTFPPVEIGPGFIPRWSGGGNRLFAGTAFGITSYDLTFSSGVRQVGAPVQVFKGAGQGWDGLGESVVVIGSPSSTLQLEPVTVIENWLDEVRRIAPPE